MPFACPHCGHSMSVKNAKPGRFTPRCPKCMQNFVLIIPADVQAEWQTYKPDEAPPVAGSGPPKPAVAANKTTIIPTQGAPADNSSETGKFDPVVLPQASSKTTQRATMVVGGATASAPSDSETGKFEPIVAPQPAAASGTAASNPAASGTAKKTMIIPSGSAASDPKQDTGPLRGTTAGKAASSAQEATLAETPSPMSGSSASAMEATGAFEGLDAPPRSATADQEATGAFTGIDAPAASAASASSSATEATGAFEGIDAPATSAPAGASPSVTSASTKPAVTFVRKISSDATAVGAGAGRSNATRVDASSRDVTVAEPSSTAKAHPARSGDDEIPNRLGGYEIVKELGRGGMGAVYLARQISLDRPVALKVMNARWASDPVFVARFVREAYAAAQLVHHNVVQIYDIGAQDGINFFSMEFVEGRSLSDEVRKLGKLDPDVAVGYILQAARGLKFAHDRGMIHRDIKPDNLMLNNQGIVKVADLGLVKTPAMTSEDDRLSDLPDDDPNEPSSGRGSQTGLASLPTEITSAHTAMGTPAYMSPEQCRDAANVDQRADIYSLGCTLYVLLTGRPPFQGTTAIETMRMHAYEPLVPPDQVEKRVPPKISAILLKMMAKDPKDRYQNMDELITALESYLGVQSTGPFTPKEEHVQELEECVKGFNASKSAKLHGLLVKGLYSASVLIVAILALFVSAKLASGWFALTLAATATYFVLNGIAEKTYLFRKVRELVFGSRLSDFVTFGLGAIAFFAILYFAGLLWYWLGFGIAGGVLAFLLRSVLDRKIVREREPYIERAEKLLKSLRLNGLEEDAIRLFVAKYSGNVWEEFFEALFGYEAKLAARSAISRIDSGQKRERFGTWREPLIHWIDNVQRARQEAKERALLRKLEEEKLKAQGVDAQLAQEQAEAAAELLVEQAAEIKASAPQELEKTVAPTEGLAEEAPAKPVNVREMLRRVDKAPKKAKKPPVPVWKTAANWAFGWKLRFAVAVLLLLLGAMGSGLDQSKIASESAVQALFGAQATTKIGALPGAAVLAGLLLLFSMFGRGLWMTTLVMIGVVVMLFGTSFGAPAAGPLTAKQYALAVGTMIGLTGLLSSRRRD